MKHFYQVTAAALLLTVLIVWCMPGASDWGETTLQRYGSRAAQ